MAKDETPKHEHDEDGQVAVSQNIQKNTVTKTSVFYCSCGDAVRVEQVSSPLDTGGTG